MRKMHNAFINNTGNQRFPCEPSLSLNYNTKFICHRVNDIKQLNEIPMMFGVEIDIRDNLIVRHDPPIANLSDAGQNESGETLEDYLSHYNHEMIIFNIKCERLELECLKLIEKYNIKNYFFLDTNIPMMVHLNKYYNNQNISARFSEFEPIEYFEKIKNMVSWVWVDCMNHFPLTREIYEKMKEANKGNFNKGNFNKGNFNKENFNKENFNKENFNKENFNKENFNKKVCIVSPELHNRKFDIEAYRQILIDNNIVPDAICCKYENIIEWI
jgi:hypothetical protein